MEKKYTVYMHVTPSGKRYIGITSRKPEYRWNHGNGYSKNVHFFNAIKKYGWGNIDHIIVDSNLSKEDACELEKMLIRVHGTRDPGKGYNHSIGGDGGATGIKRSKESIMKMIAHRDYSTSWAKGKHFSEEHRRKISESNKGKKMSEESKRKMSKSHKGLRPSWAGKQRDEEYRKKKSTPVLCVETNVTYFGLMEAERQTGIKHSNISKCLKGKREKAGGYHWKYA